MTRIPPLFAALVDDAAIFPPGLAPLSEAVPAHLQHQRSDYADLVGPLVVTPSDLNELAGLSDGYSEPAALEVSVVLPDAASIAPTLERASSLETTTIVALEMKLPLDAEVTAQVDRLAEVSAERICYVEAPRPADGRWAAVLAAVRKHNLRLKFRTGGTEAEAFPLDHELADWIHGAVEQGTPFKCTAGLHNAVRHTGSPSGFEHHGYLNILLATSAAVEGETRDFIIRLIEERNPKRVMQLLRQAAPDSLAEARRYFVSYGSCSVTEPLADLTSLGLVNSPEPTDEPPPSDATTTSGHTLRMETANPSRFAKQLVSHWGRHAVETRLIADATLLRFESSDEWAANSLEILSRDDALVIRVVTDDPVTLQRTKAALEDHLLRWASADSGARLVWT